MHQPDRQAGRAGVNVCWGLESGGPGHVLMLLYCPPFANLVVYFALRLGGVQPGWRLPQCCHDPVVTGWLIRSPAPLVSPVCRSKLAALVYVYSNLRPLAERYQLGEPYNENGAYGTAVVRKHVQVAAGHGVVALPGLPSLTSCGPGCCQQAGFPICKPTLLSRERTHCSFPCPPLPACLPACSSATLRAWRQHPTAGCHCWPRSCFASRWAAVRRTAGQAVGLLRGARNTTHP